MTIVVSVVVASDFMRSERYLCSHSRHHPRCGYCVGARDPTTDNNNNNWYRTKRPTSLGLAAFYHLQLSFGLSRCVAVSCVLLIIPCSSFCDCFVPLLLSSRLLSSASSPVMSFAGYGPLGGFGWGTTTARALEQQASLIVQHYEVTAQLISKASSQPADSSVGSSLPPFPSLEGVLLAGRGKLLNLTAGAEAAVFPAAVFTDNASESRPYQYRVDVHNRKREFHDLPKDIKDATAQFQQAALDSLQRRHAAMEKLPLAQQAALQQAAQWLCALVVNVYLRELLLYPLIRDRLEGGDHFYQRSLKQNDQLRVALRDIRNTVYKDAADSQWQGRVAEAHSTWLAGWESERKRWLPPLSDYLSKAQVSKLRDICATHLHQDIPEPSPPSSHDLSYGQQLVQMWDILTANMLKTGNLQGIPRPRHDLDWSLPDGFEPTHDLTYGAPPAERGQLPASTGLTNKEVPWLSLSDPNPQTATELPPTRPLPSGNATTYLPWGSSLTRLVRLPDASSESARTAIDGVISETANYSKSAHRRAAMAHYGSVEAEQLATRKALIASAADKATSLNEFLTEKNHTTDLSGSYYYDEVTLAFRCHGSRTSTPHRTTAPQPTSTRMVLHP